MLLDGCDWFSDGVGEGAVARDGADERFEVFGAEDFTHLTVSFNDLEVDLGREELVVKSAKHARGGQVGMGNVGKVADDAAKARLGLDVLSDNFQNVFDVEIEKR